MHVYNRANKPQGRRTPLRASTSRMKVAMVEMKPMKRLKHIIATKAVLGTLKMKEPGYMSGMIDQLKQSSRYYVNT